jgi:hypothetical protein
MEDRFAWLIVILCMSLCLAGCGGQSQPMHPVKGKVLYKNSGEPLPAGGTITFESASPPYLRATGRIEPDGSFELSTLDVGPGAPEGEHRVRVEPEVPDSVDMSQGYSAAQARIVHPKYLQFETSGLTYKVVPGENNFTVEVEKPASR